MSPQPENVSLSDKSVMPSDSSTPTMSPLPETLPSSDKSNSSSLPENLASEQNYNLGSPKETESVAEEILPKASPMDVENETSAKTELSVVTPQSSKSVGDETPSVSDSVSEVKTPESRKSEFNIDSVEFVRS